MELWLVLVGIILLQLVINNYRSQYSRRKMPPGPLVLPVIGNIFSCFPIKLPFQWRDLLHFKAYEYFDSMSKVYGPIFSLKIGKFQSVVITSYDIIKEIEHLEDYSIKVCTEVFLPRSMGEELGLIFAATPELWKEMRKFSQRTLRDFGFGKRYSMHSLIELEITDIMSQIKAETILTDGILKIRSTFLLSVFNVLWCMVAGQRYSHDDPKLNEMLNKNFAMTKALTFVDPLVLIHPKLRQIFPKFYNTRFINEVYNEGHEFSKSLIQEREQTGSYICEPENYIDCFLRKIHDNEAQLGTCKNSKTVYTHKNLMMMVEDLMQTGSTTTNGTLNYALLFLTLHPEVQRRCQKEIDSLVPRNLIPTMDDIEKMPYFQATILETHRLGNVVPIPIPRQSPRDWNIRGYFIPQGSWIVSNHYSIQMDEDYWKDPHNFRPERFINDVGEFVPDKRVCHYGFGKRSCIGITLADSLVRVYIATLLQKFNFEIVPGAKPPTFEPELGLSLSPREFPVLVTERE